MHSLSSQEPTRTHPDLPATTLEMAEFELVLALKRDEGLAFQDALRDALESSAGALLFPFPEDRFPLPCAFAAAIRVSCDTGFAFAYAYESASDGAFRVVDSQTIDGCYIDFAQAYTQVARELLPLMANMREPAVH